MTTRKSTRIIFGIFVISAWVLGSAIQAGAQTTNLNDYVAAWNSHDTEKIVSFYTDDIVYENLGIVYRGKEAIRAVDNYLFGAFPDVNCEVKSSFICGDWSASEWVMSGTHKGDIPGLPATGKRFSIRGASVAELKEGKIKRISHYYNWMTLLEQLGIKLRPAPPPK